MHNDGQYLGVHTLGDVAFEPAGLNVIIAHGRRTCRLAKGVEALLRRSLIARDRQDIFAALVRFRYEIALQSTLTYFHTNRSPPR